MAIYDLFAGDLDKVKSAQLQNTTGLNMNLGQVLADRQAKPDVLAKPAERAQAAQGTRSEVQNVNIDQAQQQQFRDQQAQLGQMLMGQATGQAPSLANAQMQAGFDQNLANQMAAAQSGRGMNAGMAARQVAQAAGAQGAQMAQQGAMNRLQEQQMAQQGLGQLLSGARSQDIGLASQQAQMNQQTGMTNAQLAQQMALANAGFTQQTNLANQAAGNQFSLANLQAQMQQQQMRDQATQGFYGIGTNRDQLQLGADQNANLLNAQREEERRKQQSQGFGQLLSGVAAGIGTAIGGPAGGALGSQLVGGVASK